MTQTTTAPETAQAVDALRDDKLVTWNGHTHEMQGAELSDLEVACRVRMLMRSDLDHESVCTLARDRIVYLSALVSEARAALAVPTTPAPAGDGVEGLRAKLAQAEKVIQSAHVALWFDLRNMVENTLHVDFNQAVRDVALKTKAYLEGRNSPLEATRTPAGAAVDPVGEAEADLREMAENSRIIASKNLCLGEEVSSAYWRGRARGLELAARLAAKTTAASPSLRNRIIQIMLDEIAGDEERNPAGVPVYGIDEAADKIMAAIGDAQ